MEGLSISIRIQVIRSAISFGQIEGFLVDEDVTFGDLKGVL